MSRRNAPENFFPMYMVAHGHAQEPTPGSAVEFWGKSMRKNRPPVPRPNIAGSCAGGGGGQGASPQMIRTTRNRSMTWPPVESPPRNFPT